MDRIHQDPDKDLEPGHASRLAELAAQAAEMIDQTDAIVVAAGAGMGVDSGLPDFRGTQGFWQAYPALARARLDFQSVASPKTFAHNPRLARGFYGHRLALYRATIPHEGFRILLELGARTPLGVGVFTSNVDGQFQRAGFEPARLHECHGSIHRLQCTKLCCEDTWTADGFEPEVDEATCRLQGDPPLCPRCGALARPNLLMFGDWDWIEARSKVQASALNAWLARSERPVVIEIGAGTAIPSVRFFTHGVVVHNGGRVVRINPTDCAVPSRHDVGMPFGAAVALRAIGAQLA
jgi:NAD-dependent SIR2 family protein deacetylase